MAPVPPTLESACGQLKRNAVTRRTTALQALLKYAENLLANPEEERYRRVNLANMAFQTKVFQVPGGEDAMLAMGFVREEGGALVFPSGGSLASVEAAVKKFRELQAEAQTEAPPSGVSLISSALSRDDVQKRNGMMARLTQQLAAMRTYESEGLQGKARRIIPVKELGEKARNREDAASSSFADRLLLELLHWFKHSFFSWVDTVPCVACGGKTHAAGMLPPTDEDRRYGAGRVENHTCEVCGHVNRFPRYNDPGRLLDTRRGRCGEWANCFVLCCRALNFDTRYVLDLTDHVWAEVYSVSQDKWLHCDPCEDACDKPRMYEAGWGKKLNYIFAFATHGVADVIWRYSGQREETLGRRDQVPESWLASVLDTINAQVWAGMPDDVHRRALSQRYAIEKHTLWADTSEAAAAENRPLETQELLGRQTGDESWRRQRGELGAGKAARALSDDATANVAPAADLSRATAPTVAPAHTPDDEDLDDGNPFLALRTPCL